LIFLLFPTDNVLRPALAPVPVIDSGFTRWVVQLVYDNDLPFNCFPSYHVTLSQLAALAVWELDREGRRVAGRLAWAVAIAIAASTVLVKQHYLADVAGGVLLAWAIHGVTLGRYSRRSQPGPDDRRSRAVLLVPLVAYAIGLLVLAVMYRR